MSENKPASDTARLGVGRCPDHGIVTENDGATVRFPSVAECHCGQELEQAIVASIEEIQSHA